MKKLFLISGPSCVGKGPLLKAINEFYPELYIGEIPIIKSHECRYGKPRTNEVDIWDNPDYFMPANQIINLDKNRFFIGDCRGFPQAIDTYKLNGISEKIVILEVYHLIGARFAAWAKGNLLNIAYETVFISPLSPEEITDLYAIGVDICQYVTSLMINKQLQRARLFGKDVSSEEEIRDIMKRASDTYEEMQSMNQYTSLIINRDGEGNPNWHIKDGSFYKKPEGDAGRALAKLVEIIAK